MIPRDPFTSVMDEQTNLRYSSTNAFYNFMFIIIEKIDKALESHEKCTLIDKMGHYFHGVLTDSWARVSGGKMRGKVRFASEEKGEIEVDINDILDLLPLPVEKR